MNHVAELLTENVIPKGRSKRKETKYTQRQSEFEKYTKHRTAERLLFSFAHTVLDWLKCRYSKPKKKKKTNAHTPRQNRKNQNEML